ncbi:hypothetical protein EUBSIR_02756 [[Eubacterium] siraeum DSM 15702]|uniref:Uncharacterized protein n=1 Tax=[Eubacterium] siraeum DSM 15702 TaxID=428128 RepID=B0MSB6_9FIRM|nr:hypothetical protein EUBSIR_02756 [[Eubacterium] siraeum DSM 15702]
MLTFYHKNGLKASRQYKNYMTRNIFSDDIRIFIAVRREIC